MSEEEWWALWQYLDWYCSHLKPLPCEIVVRKKYPWPSERNPFDKWSDMSDGQSATSPHERGQ
jgi:hypothetical protein